MNISFTAVRLVHLIIAVFSIQLISFYFSIDGVSTSIMSAIVVSQSFVGALYLKARNRLLGTAMGILASSAVVSLFPENPFFFIALSLLWVTTMTVLSSFVRNENAYIYQLAGYTYAFVSIPVLDAPDNAFHALIFRATDVTLGMSVLVITSLLLFMRYSNFNISERIVTIYKGAARQHRQIRRGEPVSAGSLKAQFGPIAELLANKTTIHYESALSLRAGSMLDNFAFHALLAFFYTNTLRHSMMIGGKISTSIRNDYDSLMNKALRYRREWNKSRDKDLAQPHRFPEYKSVSQALGRGARTLLVSALLFALWYITGWSAGSDMVILGVVYIVLLSSYPAPLSGAREIVNGTIQGALAAWLYIHAIYDFSYARTEPAFYFIAQLPFLIYGGWLMATPKTFLIGITFLTQFYLSAELSNTDVADYMTYMNSALGGISGVAIASLGMVMLFPENKKMRSRDLIIDSLRQLLRDAEKRQFDMHRQLKQTLDKLRKSSLCIAHTGDDFRVLTDIMSLYVIVQHVHLHGLGDGVLSVLIAQLHLWAEDGELHVDSECAARLQAQAANETGELQRVSLCILSLINEIGNVYEKQELP